MWLRIVVKHMCEVENMKYRVEDIGQCENVFCSPMGQYCINMELGLG